jgi:hypothetical protein
MHVTAHPQRRSERRVPAHPVLVSAEAEGMRAVGEAVNLSDGGACLALDDAMLAVGDELILRLHSGQARQEVPATARVVWTASDPGGTRCGLEWTHAGPQRQWIGWLAEA